MTLALPNVAGPTEEQPTGSARSSSRLNPAITQTKLDEPHHTDTMPLNVHEAHKKGWTSRSVVSGIRSYMQWARTDLTEMLASMSELQAMLKAERAVVETEREAAETLRPHEPPSRAQ